MSNEISINPDQSKFLVYKHTNKINNKVYIGITHTSTRRRWGNGKGYKRNDHFYSAIQKYGWENFDHEIIQDNLTENEALLLEEKLIAEYDSTNTDKGYNHLLSSVNKHPHFTEEDKKKIGEGYKKYFDSLSEEDYEEFCLFQHKTHTTPEARVNASKGQKERFQKETPEEKEARKQKHTEAAIRNRDKIIEGVRKHIDSMTDEDWQKRSEILKKAFNTPEAKQHMSEGHKRGLNTPEALERKVKKQKIYQQMLSEGKFSGKNSWNEFSSWYSKNKDNF